MTQLIKTWISQAHASGGLRAAFVDCQAAEHEKFGDDQNFHTAKRLMDGLRADNIPIIHFMLNEEITRQNPRSFLYKDKSGTNIPYPFLDFKIVVPAADDWVYPKGYKNGFQNPHSIHIFQNDNPKGDERNTLLIASGFWADDCVKFTGLGSFEQVASPENHKVIFVTDASGVISNNDAYMASLKKACDDRFKENIALATTDEVLTCVANLNVPALRRN